MLEEKKCPQCVNRVFSPPSRFCQEHGEQLVTTKTLVGRTLKGKYRIDAWIGGGGMGTVYRATFLKVGIEVAVKVLNPDLLTEQRGMLDRFRREARAAMSIQHQNAIRVIDFDDDDNLHYLVMEIVKGRELSEVIAEEGPLDYHRAVWLLAQICDAIDAAHQQKIIHRDLKPANVIVQKSGEQEAVKVLDFGIAKLHIAREKDSTETLVTQPGTVMGTPLYMSPEQCWGKELDKELGQTSDIYTLGVIGYELLSKRSPFPVAEKCGADLRECIKQRRVETPVPLLEVMPSIPENVAEVIMHALEESPANRPASAAEMAQGLREAAGSTPATSSKYTPGRSTSSTRSTASIQMKARRPLILGAAAIVAVLGLGLYLYLSGKKEVEKVVTNQPPAGMSLIKGGSFMMGRNDGDDDEGPAHQQTVADFWLDQYEVTNEQYKKFVDATGNRPPGNWANGTFPSEQAQWPVTYVTWTDAVAYATWTKKRLPTEAEWEYAARGGSQQLLYPWGSEWKDGNANISPVGRTVVQVGIFKKDVSPFGIYDLAGNVREWVQDSYTRYVTKSAGLPQCPECKVYRGGSFKEDIKDTKVTHRWATLPDIPTDTNTRSQYEKSVLPYVGFRCAKDTQ